ncbi:MAG: hypothetical protein ACR2KY_01725, partial [Thermoleophilaceae bacterium]
DSWRISFSVSLAIATQNMGRAAARLASKARAAGGSSLIAKVGDLVAWDGPSGCRPEDVVTQTHEIEPLR